ncbi:TACHY-like protein [Mya arenaria]|uniref:TACHY-like protein n=1 Tax=Mya arenaria TaxID=6604 RepID=A0ABY7DYT3_MYAAR|nr:enterin neuropeptides-like [Mya arenaria]WAR01767.1 TACHY-like protein [Mya arenaria]
MSSTKNLTLNVSLFVICIVVVYGATENTDTSDKSENNVKLFKRDLNAVKFLDNPNLQELQTDSMLFNDGLEHDDLGSYESDEAGQFVGENDDFQGSMDKRRGGVDRYSFIGALGKRRRLPMGYVGQLGKRAPLGFYGQLGKRAPMGFIGQLGKRAPMGFIGQLGKRAPMGFIGQLGKRAPMGFIGQLGKRAPMGFIGQLGKRAPMGFIGQLGKRTPMGFIGQLGKRAPMGSSSQLGKKLYENFVEESAEKDKRFPMGFTSQLGKRAPMGFFGQLGKRFPMGFRSQLGKRMETADDQDENPQTSLTRKRRSFALPWYFSQRQTPIPSRYIRGGLDRYSYFSRLGKRPDLPDDYFTLVQDHPDVFGGNK